MKRPLITLVLLSMGCGVAVSPETRDSRAQGDAALVDHSTIDHATVDASAADIALTDSSLDADAHRFDALTDSSLDADAHRFDAGTDSDRDGSADARAPLDAADAAVRYDARTFPDGPECLPTGDLIAQCQRYFGLTESDPGARFSCCWGRCWVGGCASLEAGLPPMCHGVPCDVHAGQLCCRRPANVAVCVPRDRGLCQY